MVRAGKGQAGQVEEEAATDPSPTPPSPVKEAQRLSQQRMSTTSTSKASYNISGELSLPGAYREGDGDQDDEETDHHSDAGDEDIAKLASVASSGVVELPKDDNDDLMNIDDPEQPITPVAAIKVEDDDEEAVEQARKQLLQEAVQADVVAEDNNNKRSKWLVCLLVGLAIIALVVGLSVGLTRDDGSSDGEKEQDTAGANDGSGGQVRTTVAPTPSPTVDRQQPTLERVKERGTVVCGIASRFWTEPGYDSVEDFVGLPIELCRTYAVAVFGEHEGRVEFLRSPNSDRWNLIDNRTIDVTMNFDTQTMDRDVFEASAGAGFTFTAPYAYSGLAFEGESRFVDCAEQHDSFTEECRDLKICIRPSGTEQAVVSENIEGAQFVEVPWGVALRDPFVAGECNVIAQGVISIGEDLLRLEGYTGNYSAGTSVFTRDPIAMFTRQDDAEWSDLINWVLQTLFAAEARNITQETASTFIPSTLPFREDHVLNFTAILEVGGNWKDLYLLDWGGSDRNGLNAINVDGTTGLLYSFPLGNADTVGSVNGGTLGEVLERGHLRCGVSEQAGFAEFNASTGNWTGFDIEFCRAINAALFRDESEVEFVSYAVEDRFIGLANGEVDILAGGPASYETDNFEPTSGMSFQLSQPYFYGEVDLEAGTGDVRALLTREDDQQFSDFVYWILNALVYAEEKNISKDSAIEMPVTELYGESRKQMFRDAVLATGNYGDIYNSTLESIVPRGGRNLLNTNPVGPQQFPLPFFSSPLT